MFPDGNSSIARLLVRSLIPDSFPEMARHADPHGVVTARLDYAALDAPASPVRLRLNSTAVHVANGVDGAGVTVDYVQDGQLRRVPAKRAVLACYNAAHPPPRAGAACRPQKAALAQAVKRPMLVVNAVLRNAEAFKKLGIKGVQLPGSLLQNLFLVTGVNVADYHPKWRPEDACVVQSFASFGDPLTRRRQPRDLRPRCPGADARDAVRRLRARTAQRAEQHSSVPAASTPLATSSPSP